MNRTRALLTAAAAGAALLLTGCSTISTGPDQVALHYSGGSFDDKAFENCVPTSTRNIDGPGDGHYTYPTSQRSYVAAGGDGNESGPVLVVSKDNVEMAAPVTVTFTLNTSCAEVKVGDRTYPGGMLQVFHERLGNRYAAYWNIDEEGAATADGAPRGWINLLRFAIGQPLDQAYDRTAQSQTWRDLWNNPATKTAVESDLAGTLQALVDKQTGAPAGEHFFVVQQVLVAKPDPTNEALRKAVADEQAAVSAAQSAKAKADAEKAVAEAQVGVAVAQAQGYKAEVDVLGAEAWVRKYAIDKGVNPFPAPIVSGGAPQQAK